MKAILSRLFAALLVMATLSSLLAVVVFVSYVLTGVFAGAHVQRQAAFLDTIGIIALFVAEACQVLSIFTLITQSVMSKQVAKKSREIAVLILSLIPFMVILVLLLTLVVYLNARSKSLSPERRKDLEDELKEKTLDVFIDASTNSMSSAAANIPVVLQPVSLRDLRIQHAIDRIVGPTTANNVARLPHTLLPFITIALIVATITTTSIAIPPVNHSTFIASLMHAGASSSNSRPTQPGSGQKKPSQPSGTIQEFPLSNGKLAGSIAAGSDGNLWFTKQER